MAEENADPALTQDTPTGTTADATQSSTTETLDVNAEVAALKENLATITKRYEDGRAWDTKVSQENAQLRAQLDLLKSQQDRGLTQAAADKEQERFDAEWREKAKESPESLIDYMRGVGREIRDSVSTNAKKEIDSLRAELREIRETSTPEYQQNRELIEKLVAAGADRQKAIALAKEMNVGRPGNQDRATIPGRTTASTVSTAQPVTLQPIPRQVGEVLRYLNLDEAALKRIAAEKQG